MTLKRGEGYTMTVKKGGGYTMTLKKGEGYIMTLQKWRVTRREYRKERVHFAKLMASL